jgi:hypothetical protein
MIKLCFVMRISPYLMFSLNVVRLNVCGRWPLRSWELIRSMTLRAWLRSGVGGISLMLLELEMNCVFRGGAGPEWKCCLVDVQGC